MPRFARLLFATLVSACVALPASAEHPPTQSAAHVSTGIGIIGAVEQPFELSLAQLQAWPAAQRVNLPQTRHKDGKSSQSVLSGVRLRDLIEHAKPRALQHNDLKTMAVVARASDGYQVMFSWNELTNTPVGDGVLVYFARNGSGLADDEGKIALVSLQDLRSGPRHVKWLRSITLKKVEE